ncbi:MAG: hypothetical protein ABJA98_04545 [Acidobacteriota bacterium]
MAGTSAASVAGLVATLSVVAWSIEGRGQPLQAGVRPEPISQAPATTPGAVSSTPAPRSAAPTLKVWPLTALSTERRPPTPKSGLTAGVVTKTEQRSGPVRGSAGALPPRAAAGAAARSRAASAGASTIQGPGRARGAGQESTPEFDATLETILYSPERRLAIVDGRIVQVGDEIRGARIVDITPGAVFLRDSSGNPRTLSLAAGR